MRWTHQWLQCACLMRMLIVLRDRTSRSDLSLVDQLSPLPPPLEQVVNGIPAVACGQPCHMDQQRWVRDTMGSAPRQLRPVHHGTLLHGKKLSLLSRGKTSIESIACELWGRRASCGAFFFSFHFVTKSLLTWKYLVTLAQTFVAVGWRSWHPFVIPGNEYLDYLLPA
jgi:hypothetical protein